MVDEGKMTALEEMLRGMGSVLVAYSGGVDSAFLAAVAQRVLGARALAVTAHSPSIPLSERTAAAELARKIGIRHRVVESNELSLPEYVRNAADRCYHCKNELFGLLQRVAKEEGLACIVDGNNVDDRGDYRPGSAAAREKGVRSPLQECGFTKADIRTASRKLGLPTADKPASACLASRIPYGTAITESALGAIERAEEALKLLGFAQVRVRAHGEIARVELATMEIPRACGERTRVAIVEQLRACGFRYVTLDLQGYRTGSMNEALDAGKQPPGFTAKK